MSRPARGGLPRSCWRWFSWSGQLWAARPKRQLPCVPESCSAGLGGSTCPSGGDAGTNALEPLPRARLTPADETRSDVVRMARYASPHDRNVASALAAETRLEVVA